MDTLMSLDDHIATSRPRHTSHRSQAFKKQPRTTLYTSQKSRPSVEGVWIHDRHDAADNDYRSTRKDMQTFDSSETIVTIDNLHYNVTQQDLTSLFSSIAPTKKCVLEYDRAGRSLGRAKVTYSSDRDAEDAVREFDGRLFDGMEMRVEIVKRSVVDRLGPVVRGIEERLGGRLGDRSQGRRSEGSGDRRERRGAPYRNERGNRVRGDRSIKAKLSAKELDEEMDAFMKGGDVEMDIGTTDSGIAVDKGTGGNAARAIVDYDL